MVALRIVVKANVKFGAGVMGSWLGASLSIDEFGLGVRVRLGLRL